MDNPDGSNEEVELAVGDKKLKVRGSDILTSVIGMFMFAGLVLLGYTLWEHKTDAKEGTAAVVSAVKEMSAAQLKMIAAQREQNCLIAMPQDVRPQQAQFCKQVTQ